MPIHINLLAEAQAAEEMRRRDPVKRAAFIGGALVVVFLFWATAVAALGMMARETLTGVQTTIDLKTNAYAHVLSDESKLNQARNKLADLQKFQAARFLQGNLLDALQHATVDNVQLTRLRVEQAYLLMEGAGGQTNNARARESITLHLDARDFSANPGDQVNKFMTVIAKEPYFQAMLNKTNGVQLVNPPSASQTEAGKPYVTFTLECRYPETTR